MLLLKRSVPLACENVKFVVNIKDLLLSKQHQTGNEEYDCKQKQYDTNRRDAIKDKNAGSPTRHTITRNNKLKKERCRWVREPRLKENNTVHEVMLCSTK